MPVEVTAPVAGVAAPQRPAAAGSDGNVVVNADEIDVHLTGKSEMMPPGVQRLVLTPGKNEKGYLAGAFAPRHGRLVCVEGDREVGWLSMNLLRLARPPA